MRSFLLFLFAYCLSHAAMSQHNGPPKGKDVRGAPPHIQICSISGTVSDSLSQKPLEYATVAVIAMRNDSIVGGGVTDKKGNFLIDKLQPGRYTVKIGFIGYEYAVYDYVTINPRNQLQRMGIIMLLPSAANLDQFEIIEEQAYIENGIDKKVYNISKNLSNIGGDITTVFDNIPSVEVDAEGKLSYRGNSNVAVLVDGKPSGLTGGGRTAVLDQIAANAIQAIEVISNPSAKYDPDGTSGIINIILKKDKKMGVNGNIVMNAGTRDKYNSTLSANFRKEKYNLRASYTFGLDNKYRMGTSYRETYKTDTTEVFYNDKEFNSYVEKQMVVLGGDLFINNYNTINYTSSVSNKMGDEISNNNYYYLDQFSDTGRTQFINSIEHELNLNADHSLDYTRTFSAPGRELTANAKFSTSKGQETANIFRQNTFQQGYGDVHEDLIQGSVFDRVISSAQIDYTHPFKENFNFETGAKATNRILNNNFDGQYYAEELFVYKNDSNLTNQFNYQENILAAYAIHAGQLMAFKYQIGLRGENAFTSSHLVQTDSTYLNNYFNFFPSAHLKKDMNEKTVIGASYSRRIARPSTRDLNPFANRSDPQNVRIGNPYLQPEYTDAYELSFEKNFDRKNNLTGTVYYRNTKNAIKRVRSLDSDGINYMSMLNLDNAVAMGAEMVGNVQLKNWWIVNGSFNFFRSILTGPPDMGLSNSGLGWSARFNSNFKSTSGWNLQVSGRFWGAGVTAQGRHGGVYSTDLSVRKSLLDNKASFSLRLSDVLNTRMFSHNAAGPDFYYEGTYKRESRIGYVNFTYRFGKQDRSEKGGRRPSRGDNDSDGDMEM